MIIKSILEQDLYKFTMGQLINFLFPSVVVEYFFINRGIDLFPDGFDKRLIEEINNCASLSTTNDEIEFLKKSCPFLTSVYLDFLKNFKYDPSQVIVKQNGGSLSIEIVGLWQTTIYWEVVLMAIISELYFEMTNQKPKDRLAREALNKYKAQVFNDVGAKVNDFGMRRRFSSDNHREVVEDFIKYGGDSFIGTSNAKIAMDYDIKLIGTMAHEFIMAESALRGLRYANKYAMEDWSRIYRGDLGIVLTDTYGTNAFLNDFDKGFAKQFDGVRHDSGDPYEFAELIIGSYNRMGMNPLHKTIVFSDGLNTNKVLELVEYCKGKIQCAFGVGTHLTNDVGVRALNMVIKLFSVNEIPVVKLSDVAGKATGDAQAIDNAKWTFNGSAA